jgi:hypothetical protein
VGRPKRLFPNAAGSGRPVLAFFLFSASVPAAIRNPGIATRLPRQALHSHLRLVSVFPLLFLFYFIFFAPFLQPSPRSTVVWETDRFDSTGHVIASETEEVIFRILGTSDRGMICCMICLRELEDAHDTNEAARAPAAGELQALAHFVFIRVILS